MPVKLVYPRKCEVWLNVKSGAGFLVPEDSREKILKLFKGEDVQRVGDFTASSRNDMMKQFYKLMDWEEYIPPSEEDKKKPKSVMPKATPSSSYHPTTPYVPGSTHHSSLGKGAGSSSSSNYTGSTGNKTYEKSKSAMELLCEALNMVPDSSIYRRRRALLEELGSPPEKNLEHSKSE